jgi:flagellar M-ring protein FliF
MAATRLKAPQWQPRSSDELRNLTMLAQAAVGYDPARGDTLTVEDLAFDENRSGQPLTLANEWLTLAENSPVLVKYSALLLGILVILLFGIRPAIGRTRQVAVFARDVKGKEIKGGADLPGKELPAGLAEREKPVIPPLIPIEPVEFDPERIRAAQVFEAVTEHLKREPTQSSRLLQSWIHSE